MKTLFARQLLLVFLGAQVLLSYGQNSVVEATLPVKQPKLYHPNDQIYDRLYTRLTPAHPDSVYQLAANVMQDAIVDNDGNMYVTTWSMGEKSSSEFLNEQKDCNAKICERMILERAFDLSEIHEEDIKPNLFKEHGNCIMSKGYALKSKNGFTPDKFKLNIFRGHLKSSTYMPVGAEIYLFKKSAQYIDAFKSLNQCLIKAKQTHIDSPIEEYSDVYTYVSIKPYAEFIESCMKSAGFMVERVDGENSKHPG